MFITASSALIRQVVLELARTENVCMRSKMTTLSTAVGTMTTV